MSSLDIGFSRSYANFLLHILALITLLFVSGSVSEARAGDVWREKNYRDWTAEDIYRIKYESPWTKRLAKDAPWIRGRTGYLSILPTDAMDGLIFRTRIQLKLRWLWDRP